MSYKRKISKKVLITIIVVLLAVWIIQILDNGTRNSKSEDSTVSSRNYGFSIDYKEGSSEYTLLVPPDEALFDDKVFVRSLLLTSDYNDFIESEGPREGPPSITAEVFRNPAGTSVDDWIMNNKQSNFALAITEKNTININSKDFTFYEFDGLYRTDAYVIENNGYIYTFSVSYLDKKDKIRSDFKKMLETLVFEDPGVPTQTAHNMIKVSSPDPNDTVSSPLKVRGKAFGSWFSGKTIKITLLDSEGKVLAESSVEAQREVVAEEFVSFLGTIEFTKPATDNRGTIVINKANPSGLPANSDSIQIPVIFE